MSPWRVGLPAPARSLVVLGVPYDGASFLQSAAAGGPETIRQVSPQVCTCRPDPDSGCSKPLYSPAHDAIVLRDTPLLDAGDLVPDEESPDEVASHLAAWAQPLLARDARPLVLGGDHSITYGMVQAHSLLHNTGVLYLDAHLDASPVAGVPLTHGTWAGLARALPNVRHMAQIGLRSLQPVPATFQVPSGKALTEIGASGAFESWGVDSLLSASRLDAESMERYLELLPKDLVWHLSVDVDVLDPFFMPCTGMPLPLGLEPHALIRVVRQAVRTLNVQSMDVTEFAPDGAETGRLAGLTVAGILAELLPDFLRSGT